MLGYARLGWVWLGWVRLHYGTRIVQADSGSDSDSQSRNKNEEIIPVNRLTQTVWIAPPTKDIV